MSSLSEPISPPPLREDRPDHVPAYLSNGIVGLRVPKVPLVGGFAVVNGFVGMHPTDHVAALNPAPYPLRVDIEIDGAVLSRARERATFVEQAYDFGSGELRSRFRLAGSERTASIEVTTFCSRVLPTIVAQQTTITLDDVTELTVTARVDPTGVPGRWGDREQPPVAAGQPPPDGFLRWRSLGDRTSCGIAYYTQLLGAPKAERQTADNRTEEPLTTTYRFHAEAGTEYRLVQVASLVPSVMHGDPDRQAMRLAHQAFERGFDRLRAENRAAWAELWQSRILIEGATERWQHLADAAFFYVHSSVHAAAIGGTGIFGLSEWPDYHYYRGHVMWDTDTFVHPALVLTSPRAARALLDFRTRHIDAARRHAMMAGLPGIQFPWESDPSCGEEASRSDTPEAIHEIHVNLDVALAFARHVHATGDEAFLNERAWPVISAVLEWLEDRSTRTPDGWAIEDVVGVAERDQPVANSAWTNGAARRLVAEAMALGKTFGRDIPAAWRSLGDALVLPINDDDVLVNHDGYRPDEEQGDTPEGAAAIFPLGLEVPAKVEEATFRFFLGRAEEFAGKPMLSPFLAYYAARLGDRGRALELLERAYGELIAPPFSETLEFAPRVKAQSAAPMLANTGAFLIDLLFGFPGIRMSPDDPATWAERPVVLPEGWTAICADRLTIRGRPWSLRAQHGDDHATLERMPG